MIYRVEEVVKRLALFTQFAGLSSNRLRTFAGPLPHVSSHGTWNEMHPRAWHLQQRKGKQSAERKSLAAT